MLTAVSPLTAHRRTSTSLSMLRLPSMLHLTVFLLAACTSTAFLTSGIRRSSVVSPLSFTRAPSCIDFKKTNSRTLTLYATQQTQPFANSTAAWSLRAMALALCVTAFRDPKPLSMRTAVRLSTAAITYIDFAPMMDIQWRNSTLALATNDSTQTRKYQQLVRLKFAGELLGLAIMLQWACLGAASILSSHVLFWILGAGSTRVDADGNPAPVPFPLVRMICRADMIVGVAALLGALGPSRGLRTAGAALYSILVSALCVSKLKQKAQSQNRPIKTNASATIAKGTTEGQRRDLENNDEYRRNLTSDSLSSPWKYDWRSKWYPLAFAKVTSKATPHRLELFGEHLVLWHNGTQWAALADSCPHRLAPLSEGRIDEVGQIECPYHGWTFGPEGSCTKIPQATQNQSLASCSARSYRVVEQQGIIFVWGNVGASEDEADTSLVPICPAMEDDRFVWIDFSRDLPYSADMLLENVLDSSHVSFTHDSTISKRENASPLPLKLTTPIVPAGFAGEMASDVPIGKVGQTNAKNKRVTQRRTNFVAPTYMNHIIRSANVEDMDFDNGFETWTVAYATPTGPGRSRLLARFPFRFPPPKRRIFGRFTLNLPALIFKFLPDWMNHLGQLRVTDDDNIFLPIQERHVQDVGGWKKYKMPTDSDAFVRAFRRWYDKAGPPPHSPFAMDEFRTLPLSKEQLLDRKSQHTDHCASCSGALKNASRIRAITHGALLACVAAAPSLVFQKAWKPLGGLLVASGVFFQIRKTASFVETSLTTGVEDYPPPRNQPQKKAKELRTVEQGRAL